MTASSDDFNPLAFEKRLTQLKDTQDSIQSLSTWCLQQRHHHKKIVASWLNVLKRAKVEHRLTLFYLANDVIQYSKRKHYEFVESWGTTLQKATPLVRDDKVKQRILRIFRIWEERGVYDDEFLTDLTGLLSAAAGKQTPDVDPSEFQAIQLVNKIRQCAVLEAETDLLLKNIHECHLALKDTDSLLANLKERRDFDEVTQELDEGIAMMQAYVRSLQKELVARAALCHLLQRADLHYTTQRGEVRVVANAYRNFGGRVRVLKRRLDDTSENLPSAAPSSSSQLGMPGRSSPVPSPPSPGAPVPSPGPDEDLDLPGQQDNGDGDEYNMDKTFSTSLLGEDMTNNRFTSFMGQGDFPFFSKDDEPVEKEDTGGNKIEVINPTPRENFNINEFLKTLIPTKPPASVESEPIGVPAPEPYMSDHGAQWNSSWILQSSSNLDTPESPPPVEQSVMSPPSYREVPPPPPPPRSDVDHRTLLAPPPPPNFPDSMLEGDDVDHRMLPPLPPIQQTNERSRQTSHKGDVDHRNLISLTGSLPPPPAPPITSWSHQSADQDYRNLEVEIPMIVPPPSPPHLRMKPSNNVQHPSKNTSPNLPPNHLSKNIPNNISSVSSLPPNMSSHLPPNMQSHTPNMSSLPPNMPSHSSNMSNPPPNMSGHSPNISSLPPNMMSHPPNVSTLPPNMPCHSINISNLPPNMPSHPQGTMSHQSSINMPPPHHSNNISHLPPSNMLQHPPGMLHQNNRSQTPLNMMQHQPNMMQHAPNMHLGNLHQHRQNMSHMPPNMNRPPPTYSENAECIESVDMEMSDDEMLEHDDEYGHHVRLESALARLHGNLPQLVRNVQHPFRKSDHQLRDTPFSNNNNKVLVGGDSMPQHTPTNLPQSHSTPIKVDLHKNDNINTRSNLVRINSIPDSSYDQDSSDKIEIQSEDIISDEDDENFEDLDDNSGDKDEIPPLDIFDEALTSSMNPVNPNPAVEHKEKPDKSSESLIQSQENELQEYNFSQDVTEEKDIHTEESPNWRNQMLAINPPRPNIPHMRPFHMRGGPSRVFRHPVFNRLPPPEMFFNSEYQPRGGMRRPWGLRPPRGFW